MPDNTLRNQIVTNYWPIKGGRDVGVGSRSATARAGPGNQGKRVSKLEDFRTGPLVLRDDRVRTLPTTASGSRCRVTPTSTRRARSTPSTNVPAYTPARTPQAGSSWTRAFFVEEDASAWPRPPFPPTLRLLDGGPHGPRYSAATRLTPSLVTVCRT